MQWSDAWDKFYKSGNISDYINYSSCYNKPTNSENRNENNANYIKWDSGKGTNSRG